MGRVAVVTGGTRGIGHAISIALKHKGCRVAATYAGNDAAARQFQAETGIPVYKFDVGDYAACQDGVTRIARDLKSSDRSTMRIGPLSAWRSILPTAGCGPAR